MAKSAKSKSKKLKPCQTRKKGRVVLKKGFRYGKRGTCVKAKKAKK
jgi:hypothetical protein